jgi:hypothetical protein
LVGIAKRVTEWQLSTVQVIAGSDPSARKGRMLDSRYIHLRLRLGFAIRNEPLAIPDDPARCLNLFHDGTRQSRHWARAADRSRCRCCGWWLG